MDACYWIKVYSQNRENEFYLEQSHLYFLARYYKGDEEKRKGYACQYFFNIIKKRAEEKADEIILNRLLYGTDEAPKEMI